MNLLDKILEGDLPSAVIVIAGVILIVDKIFSFVVRMRDRKALEAITSGDKPVEFWLLAFHEIVKKGVQPLDERQREIMREIEAFYEEFRDFKARHKDPRNKF